MEKAIIFNSTEDTSTCLAVYTMISQFRKWALATRIKLNEKEKKIEIEK